MTAGPCSALRGVILVFLLTCHGGWGASDVRPGPEGSTIEQLLAEARSLLDGGESEKSFLVCRRAGELLRPDGGDADARIRLAWVLLDLGRPREAMPIVQAVPPDHDQYVDALFVLAMANWHAEQYVQSLKVYNRLLSLRPGNAGALNLKSRVLSTMGCCSLALDFALAHKESIEPAVWLELEQNLAAQRIRWEEPEIALVVLDRVIAAGKKPFTRLRARFDRVLALRQMRRMGEIIGAYEEMLKRGIEMPYWVRRAAGDAYLAMRKPKKAIELYEAVIAEHPGEFNPRMALYHALLEIGEYERGREVLDGLRGETADWVTERGILRYNMNKEEVRTSYGWWRAYQNRQQEAQDYLGELLDMAPANLSLRSALGHVHLWRGWPHRALEDFDAIITMSGTDTRARRPYEDEYDIGARNGRVYSLNECGLRREARDYAEQLVERNPLNSHTRQAHEELRIEDGTEFLLDVVYTLESPGAEGYLLDARVTQPVNPELALYAQWSRRWAEEEGNSVEYDRLAAGVEYLALPSLELGAEANIVMPSDDPGLGVETRWRPADVWAMGLQHETTTLDVSLRASARDIRGRRTTATADYNPSDMTHFGFSGSFLQLDDGNENVVFSTDIDRLLIRRGYLETRMSLHLSRGENSMTNVAYFSPESDTTVLLRHRVDHALFQRYERAFVHQLRVGFGSYEQAGYGREPIWDARYQHDLRVSRRTSVLWGVSYSRRVYDGEDTDVWAGYLTAVTHW